MRIRLAIPQTAITAPVLNAALEASTLANERLLQMGEAPSIEDAIRQGVRWKPEPFTDGEHFDLAPVAAARGWGDCDDLAPWLAADLRLRGDSGAHAFAKKTGPNRWHALVRAGNGEILDPSKWAGMGQRKGARAAISGQMAPPGGGAMCLIPHPRGGWAARADLPWGTRHFSGLARERNPEEALLQAARGAALVGEASGVDLGDFETLVGALCGDQEDQESVGWLDKLLDVAKTAAPIAASLIPGVGPIAAAAIPAAGSLLSSLTRGGGGGGGGGAAAPPARGEIPVYPVAPPPGMRGGGGQGMAAFPLPGGGHVAYNPAAPIGPVIVRF